MANKSKVLVIESEASTRALIRNMLRDKYEVETLGDAEEILKKIRAGEEPALIIADILMPGMDGFTFIEKLRREEGYQDLPLIVLSNREHSDDRIRAMRLGADDYVVKPFNPEELSARIVKVMQ